MTLALPLLLGLAPVSNGGLTKSPWPKFHGGAGNEGLGVGSGAVGKLLGGQGTGGYVFSSPAIEGSGSSTGAVQWRFTTGGKVASSAAIGANGTVVIGSHDEKTCALRGSSRNRPTEP